MSILSDGYSMLQNFLNQLCVLELHSRVLLKLKISIKRKTLLFSSTKRKKKDNSFRHIAY